MSEPKNFTFIVEHSDSGLRLDKFLTQKIEDVSRTSLQYLIEKGHVIINAQPASEPSQKVRENQLIEVRIPPPVEATPTPQNIPLDILFEDDDLLVLNKTAGMVVHPAPGNPEGTLVNALLSHCGDSLSGINGVKRPGIVHRLDKETSGLLVVAKNDKAHSHLAHQLTTREMGRTYWALVWGMLIPQEGTIEGSIVRHPHHRQRMTIRSNGKFARTHYKVLHYYGKLASLVECRLDTGRTHQIRVHLTAKGHPLIGDKMYGKIPRTIPAEMKTYLEDTWPPGRQALHAKTLSFEHPTTKKWLEFSTEAPEDIHSLIDMLNSTLKSA